MSDRRQAPVKPDDGRLGNPEQTPHPPDHLVEGADQRLRDARRRGHGDAATPGKPDRASLSARGSVATSSASRARSAAPRPFTGERQDHDWPR